MDKMNEEAIQLTLENMKLVTFLMKKYFHIHGQDWEDYRQEGMIGLWLASMRFDPDTGNKFSTYASHYILGFLKRYKRDNTLVHEPRNLKDRILQISRYKQEHGDDCDEDDMLKELKIRRFEYYELIAARSIIYIDAHIQNDSDKDDKHTTFEYFLSDQMYEDSTEYKENEELLIVLKEEVLREFSKRNQDIYDDYFYSKLFGDKVNQEYLSTKYNVSQAYVSRIIKKVNDKLIRKFKKYLSM